MCGPQHGPKKRKKKFARPLATGVFKSLRTFFHFPDSFFFGSSFFLPLPFFLLTRACTGGRPCRPARVQIPIFFGLKTVVNSARKGLARLVSSPANTGKLVARPPVFARLHLWLPVLVRPDSQQHPCAQPPIPPHGVRPFME